MLCTSRPFRGVTYGLDKKNKFGHGKNDNSSYKGKFLIEFIQQHTNNSQMCAFLSSIHNNEKLRKHGFNQNYPHHTIKYIPDIPLINKNNQNIMSISPCHRH